VEEKKRKKKERVAFSFPGEKREGGKEGEEEESGKYCLLSQPVKEGN